DADPGGWGCHKIARHLNEVLGVAAPRGGKWHTYTVAAIVRCPTYRGEVVYERKKRSYLDGRGLPKRATLADPDVVPPIVDEATWEAANASILHRSKHGRGRPAKNHPAGLFCSYLRCTACGYIYAHTQEHNRANILRRYVCGGRKEAARFST